MGRARDISKVFSTSTALATDTEVSTTYQTKATAGLTLLTPGSITNTGGTASIGANGTVTFSGVASQSFNNVFSATYDNYKVFFSGNASTSTGIELRLRVGGVDNSAASAYLRQYLRAENTTVSGGRTTSNILRIGQSESTLRSSFELTIYNPFAATVTPMNSLVTLSESSAMIFDINSAVHNVASSFDGFTLIPVSGTITGSISIYGMNK